MLTALPAACSPFSLSRLEEIVRTSQLVICNSKKFSGFSTPFHSSEFRLLQSGFFQSTRDVFRKDWPSPISKQGVHKRIIRRAASFLLGGVKALLKNHSADVLVELESVGKSKCVGL